MSRSGLAFTSIQVILLDSNTKNSYKMYFDFMYQNQSGVQHLKSMLGIKQILLVWLNPRNLQFYVLLKDPPYQHSGENLTGVNKKKYLIYCLEPVGSAAPKVNIKLKAVQSSLGEKLALVCPAQGMPLPAFR